jgi:pyruvate/2-oxoglutarate dehydrogenase complex dihydrolipoamide dehydrogenase (E3) component
MITQGIGLELAGVELTNRGYVKVNERLETAAPGVWAVGDVAGSPHFTHISVEISVWSLPVSTVVTV